MTVGFEGRDGGLPSSDRRLPFLSRDQEPAWDRLALVAIWVGLILRVVVLYRHSPDGYVYSDMQGYVGRAMAVAAGGGPRRDLAFFPPGTHLLLAVPLKIFGSGHGGKLPWADVMWCGLSALQPLFAWRLARLLLGPATAAIAAAFCAGYPLFIMYSGFFTSETPATALLCAALWLGYLAVRSPRWKGLAIGAGGGLVGGALVATRPQFMLNLALVGIAMLWRFRSRWRAALGFGLGLMVVVTAVFALNSHNTGHFTTFSEDSGLQLYQGNCPVHEVFTGQAPGPRIDVGSPVNFELQRGHDVYFPDHVGWDSGFFYRQGLACLKNHPLVIARNLADLTVTSIPFPFVNEIGLSRIADVTNIVYCAALLGALAVLWRLWRRGVVARREWSGPGTMLVHLAMLIPVTAVYGSEPRYRIPYDVFGLALLAWLIANRSRRSPAKTPDQPVNAQPTIATQGSC